MDKLTKHSDSVFCKNGIKNLDCLESNKRQITPQKTSREVIALAALSIFLLSGLTGCEAILGHQSKYFKRIANYRVDKRGLLFGSCHLINGDEILVNGPPEDKSNYLFDDGNWRSEALEIFDSKTQESRDIKPSKCLLTDRYGKNVLQLKDGRIIFVGGINHAERFLSGTKEETGIPSYCYNRVTVEIYNPVDNSWSIIEKPDYKTNLQAMTQMPNGKVLFVGGYRNKPQPKVAKPEYKAKPAEPIEIVEFDPDSQTFKVLKELIIAREAPALVTIDNKVFIIGGLADYKKAQQIEVYDYENNSSKIIGRLIYPRTQDNIQAYALDHQNILIAGGAWWDPTLSDSPENITDHRPEIEVFNIKSGKSKVVAKFEAPISYTLSNKLPDGKLLFVGGLSYNKRLHKEVMYNVRLFNPKTGKLQIIDQTIQPVECLISKGSKVYALDRYGYELFDYDYYRQKTEGTKR